MNEVEVTTGKTDLPQTMSESIADETAIPNLFTISLLIQHLVSVPEQEALEEGLALTTDSINEKAPGNVLLFVQRANAEHKIDKLIQMLREQYPDLPFDEMMCAPGLVAPESFQPFSWPSIANLLQDVFPEPMQFDGFLKSYFPDFTDELGEDVEVATKARKLVVLCDRHDCLSRILSILQANYPDRYEALAPYTRSEGEAEKKKREGLEIVNLQKESFIVLDRELTRREQQLPQTIALVKHMDLPAQKMRMIRDFVWMDDDLVLNMFKENVCLLAHDSMELEEVEFFVGKEHLLKLPKENQLLAIGKAGGQNTYLQVWDLGSRSVKVAIENEKMHGLTAVTHSPDGKTAVTGHRDNTIRLWDLEIGQMADEWHGHPREVRGLNMPPNGEYLLSFGWDNTLRIWDFDKGNQITTIDVPGRIQRTALSQDGSMLAAHYDIGSDLYIYGLEYKMSGLFSKKREAKVRLITKLSNMKRIIASPFSFSADDRFFAATIGGRITTIWRTDDWSVYATLPHSSGSALAFHSKRPLLAMANNDNLGMRILEIK